MLLGLVLLRLVAQMAAIPQVLGLLHLAVAEATLAAVLVVALSTVRPTLGLGCSPRHQAEATATPVAFPLAFTVQAVVQAAQEQQARTFVTIVTLGSLGIALK